MTGATGVFADIRELFLERIQILLGAVVWHIATIQQHVYTDALETIRRGLIEHGKQMIHARMYIAIR